DAAGFLLSDTVTQKEALAMGAGGPADVNFARVAVSSMASTAKEKCLPVLQASVLAVYIDMCGKKVDRATELQDKLNSSGQKRGIEHLYFICMHRVIDLATEMKPKINELETSYKQLLQFQTDAVLDAGTPPTRKTKEDLLKCYATCTRLDLALNALMIRGRTIKVPTKGKSAPKTKTPKAKAKSAKRPHSAGGSSAGLCSGDHNFNIAAALVNNKRITTLMQKQQLRELDLLYKLSVHYPVIFPSTWIKFLLKTQSYLLLGGHNLEDERHTFCTRFLYTVVPAELYWHDVTLTKLNEDFAADLCRLFTVETSRGPITIHCAVVGIKGDWVYLRKDSSSVLFVMLKYTVSCANTYFRILHHGGLWLDASTSLQAATACEEMTALWIKNAPNLLN
ncbi:unnamed protein product, partial [Symbiodinium sp. KB8]